MDPDFALAHAMLAWCYLVKHENQFALDEAEKGAHARGAGPDHAVNVAAVYAVTGEKGKARNLLLQLESESEHQHEGQLFVGIAQMHAALGEEDQAFAWLEKAYQNRDGGLTLIKMVPYLDSLHGDPRFADLVRRIGLPP